VQAAPGGTQGSGKTAAAGTDDAEIAVYHIHKDLK
jgi:hypothetical protein